MSGHERKAGPERALPHAGLLARDTIVAIATAWGTGAIAVLRVSGPDTERICRCVLSPSPGWPLEPRRATRTTIHSSNTPSAVLDNGLVVLFPAPRSYTGETVVELSVHGGEYVSRAVCAALIEAGARQATPGEFTARAVMNGKLDLLRAEAIADLIDARSGASHRMALHQLAGVLSNRLASLRETVLRLEAMLAYDIDFPEEDDGALPRDVVLRACAATIGELDVLLQTRPAAILLHDGALVVLAGSPNAGKSSLLNALVGEARMIVSETPGTTRDAVEVVLEQDPCPLRLVDTAGLRHATDPVELLGIQATHRYLARAHVVIACAETTAQLRKTTLAIAEHTTAPIVGALTKCDLASDQAESSAAGVSSVPVSAVRGDGLQQLLAAVSSSVGRMIGPIEPDAPILTRARHKASLMRARAELVTFSVVWQDRSFPALVAATHVRAARAALDELIGTVDVEEVFARVFSSFCVGK